MYEGVLNYFEENLVWSKIIFLFFCFLLKYIEGWGIFIMLMFIYLLKFFIAYIYFIIYYMYLKNCEVDRNFIYWLYFLGG